MIHRAILRTGPETWTEYTEPEQSWIVAEDDLSPGMIEATLEDLEKTVESRRREAIGFLTYEASRAWGLSTVRGAVAGAVPPLSFTIFREQHRWDAVSAMKELTSDSYTCGPWNYHLREEEYRQKLTAIREYLRRGDTYQVNFTFPMTAHFSGSPLDFFIHLSAVQDGLYSAYLELDNGVKILSASPELFLERRGTLIQSLPMKGTARRGANGELDTARIVALRGSPKERAENLMITDMIRNDLGRIADPGTVRTPELFTVQRYPRILQMVSRVEAHSDASLAELLRATFPCASITGAPKERTMEIISELEETPRGVYTGSIGIVAPDRRLRLSVAIRTVVVDAIAEQATFNVGSGILWDSAPAGEYDECRGKAEILTARQPEFSILETMGYHTEEGILFAEEHWHRLAETLEYFQRSRPTDISDLAGLKRLVAEEVARATGHLGGDAPVYWRVRLRVHQDRTQDVTVAPLTRPFNWGTQPLEERTLAILPAGIATESPWIFHKTTHREIYDSALRQFPEADDVILWNKAGEITETCTASVVLQRPDGSLATPPVSSGLLPGTFRKYLLQNQGGAHQPWTPGSRPIQEEPIRRTELEDVRRGNATLYMLNSVRGWMRGVIPALLIALYLFSLAPVAVHATAPTIPEDPGYCASNVGVPTPQKQLNRDGQ
jgi:para-aminobenzoate synthetase/4-amino-4-deoxychorismate lyase